MAELDELFNGNLDDKMDFLKDQVKSNNDGIYRIDLSKAKDKKKGWRSVVRLLPNLTQDSKLGQSAIEKIAHYVKISNPRELSGWFDSPKNFGEKCPLTDLYYSMQNSKNAILMEKSKMLNYSKKYYSYVLVLEDEQQPELVGKIMIYQYGKTIKDKIQAEKNGDITGVPCTVFDPGVGKDLVLIVKEIQTGDETYPDYKMSMFKPEVSSLPIYFKEKGEFKSVPVDEDGKIESKYQGKVRDFLLDRENELEDFAPQVLTDEQHAKISEITNFMTGKAANSYANAEKSPSTDDFNLDSNFSESTNDNAEEDEDDFFNDM